MEKMTLAPIVFFAYARPDHTRKTLEALSQNLLAAESLLIIHVDGVQDNASEAVRTNNEAVKRVVRERQWCGQVVIQEEATNKGLARSIREGVTAALEQYGQAIVVEDDIITSPQFLAFMNQALQFYASYPAVFSIGGYNYPVRQMAIPDDYPYDTYACLRNCSWGWATWKDRWDRIDWTAQRYRCIKNQAAIREAYNRMGDDAFDLLRNQQEQRMNIWSVLFSLAHFENHAVAIIPCVSYVNNIGLDGSGENCGILETLSHGTLNNNGNPKYLDIIYEDKRIINAFYNVNCTKRLSLRKRAANRLSRWLLKRPVFLKGDIYR